MNTNLPWGTASRPKLYDLLEALIRVRYSREKLPQLYALNLQLETLRHFTRLLLDLELLSARRFEYAGQQINGIGTELGGWIKQQRGKPEARG